MKKEIVLDEVLIRFHDGVFSGAHVIYLEKFMEDDGTVIFQKLSNPVTIIDVPNASDDEKELFNNIMSSKIISALKPTIENTETYQPIPETTLNPVTKPSFWNRIFGET